MSEIDKSGSVRDVEVARMVQSCDTPQSKERSNREYKPNLNEEPYYVYSTIII